MENHLVPEPSHKTPSTIHHPLLLRSRLVLPVVSPAIENGAVLFSGNQIAAVGKWQELKQPAEVIDLGDSILMPGLVNAHCHLDYTDMAGTLPPQKLFTDWIKLMLAAKAEWNYTEYAHSWLHGSQMLLRTGTTTVGDFEAVPELLPDVWSSTPLRVTSFLEMTGVKKRRSPQAILDDALRLHEELHDRRSRIGLGPHAPYSTAPELVRLTAQAARERQVPVSMHLSESILEFEMFTQARGAMFEWLHHNGRDMSDCGLGSPVQHLERLGALDENLIVVHLNYLAAGDADLLGRRSVSVAHCPRSHHYFQHSRFPIEALMRAGVNVCLGTDSLATVYKTRKDTIELSLFDEMRSFAQTHPGISPEDILQLATIKGAQALGLGGQVGQLSAGALADMIVVPYLGKTADASEAAVHHRGNVMASMIDGQWSLNPEAAIG